MQFHSASPLFSLLLHYMAVPGCIAHVKFSMLSSLCSEVDVLGACFPTICLPINGVPLFLPLQEKWSLGTDPYDASRASTSEMGREAQPSAAIIDSQSVKTIGLPGPHGYDAGKKIKGRKHHLLVDTVSARDIMAHRTFGESPARIYRCIKESKAIRYATSSMCRRKSSKPARPYIILFNVLSLLMNPSVTPWLQGSCKAAFTAS